MHKEIIYARGYCRGKDRPLTMRALTLAIRLHGKQLRKDGNPYILHPLKGFQYLITHKIEEDVILAAMLLHDTIEDTDTTYEYLVAELGEEVAQIVNRLSKKKSVPMEEYFGEISKDVLAIIIKAADRTSNVGDMIKCYSIERLERYVEETEKYILPMMHNARDIYLEYGDILVSLRNNINVVLTAVKVIIKLCRENNLKINEEVS